MIYSASVLHATEVIGGELEKSMPAKASTVIVLGILRERERERDTHTHTHIRPRSVCAHARAFFIGIVCARDPVCVCACV